MSGKGSIVPFAVIISVFSITLQLSILPSYGDLNSFGNNVNRERKSSSNSSSGSSSFNNDNDDSSCMGSCLGSFFSGFFDALFSNGDDDNQSHSSNQNQYNNQNYKQYQNEKSNQKIQKPDPDEISNAGGSNNIGCFIPLVGDSSLIKYTSYPYSDRSISNFVVDMNQGGSTEDAGRQSEIDEETASYFYTIILGGQYAYSNGWGMSAAISGRFLSWLGPELQFVRYEDGDNWLHQYEVGLNVPLAQGGPLLFDLILQYGGMSGVVNLNGFIFGFKMTLLPVRPLVITAEYSYHIYDGINFHDVGGTIGLAFRRFEVFGGYRYMKAEHAQIDGPTFGVRIWL